MVTNRRVENLIIMLLINKIFSFLSLPFPSHWDVVVHILKYIN